jgi:hypothetical protein
MPESTLITHTGAQRVTRPQLAGIAPPYSTATHRPIAHAELVDLMEERLQRAGYRIVREQYAVQRAGMVLFGTLDLENHGATAGPGTGLAVGFRHANDKTMALKAVAGARIFICDNLAMCGDSTVFKVLHRHGVIGLLRQSFDRYFGEYDQAITMLRDRFGVWQASPLQDIEAKALVYDAVTTGVIPGRLLDDIHVNYFRGADLGYADCAPRSKWGLHNAFTRAFKSLNPAPAFSAQLGLTRLMEAPCAGS